jgi:hypothetical protein
MAVEWTTTPPAEPGWYWARPRIASERWQIVCVLVDRLTDGQLAVMDIVEHDYGCRLTAFTHWRPAAVPAAPVTDLGR